MSKTPLTPEERVHRSEVWRHREVEALETVAGAAAGAVAGIAAGPVGMVAGAVIGGAIGAVAVSQTERADHLKAEHEKDLDAVGTDSLRGTAQVAEMRKTVDREKEDRVAKALQAEAIDDQLATQAGRATKRGSSLP